MIKDSFGAPVLVSGALALVSTLHYLFLPASLGYITFCFLRYRNSMKYLRKTSVMIQFTIIILLAALLREGYKSGNYISMNGLIIGLKMNLRASVIPSFNIFSLYPSIYWTFLRKATSKSLPFSLSPGKLDREKPVL